MRLRAPLQGKGFPLEQLASLLPHLRGLSSDSRRIEMGMGFAAYPGEAGDGRSWIDDALARGAGAVLWEPQGFRAPPVWSVPQLAVPDLKRQASRIAAQVYGDPSGAMQVIGVTGTNGKTSCTHWLAQALNALHRPCGLVGTLGTGMPGQVRATGFTTPGPVELQQQLAELRSQGALAVAMEVSSHGLAQGRVDGVHFDIALFTNLTRDHLDFHGDMRAYGEAKALLFRAAGLRQAVINLDDAFGAELYDLLRGEGLTVVGYTRDSARVCAGAPLRARDVQFTPEGTRFTLDCAAGSVALASHLVGAFNLSNLLGVIACLLAAEVTLQELPALVAALQAPPGRLQGVGRAGRAQVISDYAHTPDALEQVLHALRPSVGAGRLWCVFGCGGDRDPGKRPQMGRIAEQFADRVILTSDNPRSEDPHSILAAIAAGMDKAAYAVEADRAAAIALAIAQALPGDIVLLAGKGHETTQEIAGRKQPFSDYEQAQRCLALGAGAA